MPTYLTQAFYSIYCIAQDSPVPLQSSCVIITERYHSGALVLVGCTTNGLPSLHLSALSVLYYNYCLNQYSNIADHLSNPNSH